VIDPTKVVRCEIENAAGVAALLLTGDVSIIDKPEKGGGKNGNKMGMN
jgi:chaperonin GroEL